METSVTVNGRTYVISDGEWVTVPRYCELYGIKHQSVIANWIRRGIIYDDEWVKVPELAGTILIRAKQYKEWYPLLKPEENAKPIHTAH